MRQLQIWLLVMLLLPILAHAQVLPHQGETLADDATVEGLEHSVIETAKIQGGCQALEAIRIEPISSDFNKDDKLNGFSLELWTAIGCNSEFPIWVAWRRAPPSGGVTQMLGLYKWRSKAS